MRRLAILSLPVALVASCTGMRPALDKLGSEIHETNGKQPVDYLGEGCYLVGEKLLSCSIDFLPAGKLSCAREPFTNGQVSESDVGELYAVRGPREDPEKYYDSNLDGFVEVLNTHRCHERWYDTFVMAPIPFTLRDVRTPDSTHFVPLAELGIEVPPMISVSHETARQMCRFQLESVRWSTAICVDPEGAVSVDDSLLNQGWRDAPDAWDVADSAFVFVISDFRTTMAATRGTPAATKRCAVAEVAPRELRCLRGTRAALAS